MLGRCGSGGWRVSPDVHRSLSSGSMDMDSLKATRNVWGAEEAFFSPPELSGSLAASADSEESSEDCEGYISGLAEEIAQSMLQEEEETDEEVSVKMGAWGIQATKVVWNSHKLGSSPTSPQSTLAGVGGYNWETRSNKDASDVSSPPTPSADGDAVDGLHEELLRVKLEDQAKVAGPHHILPLRQQIIRRPSSSSPTIQRQASPRTRSRPLTSTASRGRSGENHSGRDNVLSMAIDRALMAKQARQARSKGGAAAGGSPEVGTQAGVGWGGMPGGGGGGKKGSANNGSGNRNKRKEQQQLQHSQVQAQHFPLFTSSSMGGGNGGSGSRGGAEGGPMRAVFLGAPASRESGGTGVFLPRRLGSTYYHHLQDSKGRPACSTVLLPSHIVQALNLNVEDTLPPSFRRDISSANHRFYHHSQVENDRIELKQETPSNHVPTSHSATLQEVAPNISLPSEWTY